MSILELPAESPSTEEDETAQMLQHGITRVSVDYFHFREFRYTPTSPTLWPRLNGRLS